MSTFQTEGTMFPDPSVAHAVTSERFAQVRKGYHASHDDQHVDCSLALAASLLADPDGDAVEARLLRIAHEEGERFWVVRFVRDRIDRSQQENLITAAALSMAEVERLRRLHAYMDHVRGVAT